MSSKSSVKPLSVALGTVFTLSLANMAISNAADNPFGMEPLSGGYMMLAENKSPEGKCGEGKCGGKKGKGMGKQCMTKMDADGDGNISREEFMKGHEVKFDQIDANSDGVIDASERDAHRQQKKGKGKGKGGEGKCGEGKCGGSM